MLKHIQNFSNESTFSKITTEKDLDITIYQINLKNFPNNLENTQINGIEAFDQWISYNVDNNYSIIGNSEILGLSINENIIHSNELGIYLDTVTRKKKCQNTIYREVTDTLVFGEMNMNYKNICTCFAIILNLKIHLFISNFVFHCFIKI